MPLAWLRRLTFPIFAGLFAGGGDEQIPLLRCIEQQNPCTVPAAYLALSARTRRLLATFLRLALDKVGTFRQGFFSPRDSSEACGTLRQAAAVLHPYWKSLGLPV